MTYSWDQNAIDDFIFDMLNIAGVTGLVSSRIYNHRVPSGTPPQYPLVRYQVWSRFRPQYTLGNGRSHYKGSYRIVGIAEDDPRGAKAIQKQIEAAMIANPVAISTGQTVVVCRPQEYTYDEQDLIGDGKTYILAGVQIELEVTA